MEKVVDTAQIEQLCAIFELGKPTEQLQSVYGGMLHRIWRLHTAHGLYAVKQLNSAIMMKPGIRDAYRLSERIANAMLSVEVPAVPALHAKRNGDTVQEIGDTTFLVYNWKDGVTLPSSSAEPERSQRIGTILAHMHSLPIQDFPELTLPDEETYAADEWDMLTFQAADRDIPWAQPVRNALPLLIEWSNLATQARTKLHKHVVISHRDVDQKNVLWHDSQTPFIIDWEASGLTNPTMDVVGAALAWSGQTVQPPREESFNALLEGYIVAGGKLLDDGHTALYGVMDNMLAWLIFNMYRSLGESVTSEEEQHLGISQTTHTLSSLRALATHAEEWAHWIDRL